MNRVALLLFALTLASCASPTPYSTTVGTLPHGATMSVVVDHGDVVAYKPAVGQASNLYTISATAPDASGSLMAPAISRSNNGIAVKATDPLASLLVRVPMEVNLDVYDKLGNVSVTDVSGNPDVYAVEGNVNVMVPGYAEASTNVGNVTVTLGSTDWPGTLHFKALTGDVVVWVPETAKFRVRLHTDNGTIFSDFGVTGTSQGASETIEQNVNGGGPRAIDIEVHQGIVRLMRLHPEA